MSQTTSYINRSTDQGQGVCVCGRDTHTGEPPLADHTPATSLTTGGESP